MPCTSLATLPSPFHCDPTQGFSCAHLCVSCHSISVTLHPLLLSSLPSLTKSILCRALALLCMSIPLLSHSECRLAIQQHVLSTLCRFRAHVSPLFSAKAFLFFSLPPHFCSIRGLCRNHAHLSVLCHRISVRFYASSQPFCSSAQLRCPYFSLARHSISVPSLIYCSHLYCQTYHLNSFTFHTLRIHCRAMRSLYRSLPFPCLSGLCPSSPLPCHRSYPSYAPANHHHAIPMHLNLSFPLPKLCTSFVSVSLADMSSLFRSDAAQFSSVAVSMPFNF